MQTIRYGMWILAPSKSFSVTWKVVHSRQAALAGPLGAGGGVAVESAAANALLLFGVGLGWRLCFVTATVGLADLTTPTQRVYIPGSTTCSRGIARDGIGPTGGFILLTVGFFIGISRGGLEGSCPRRVPLLRAVQVLQLGGEAEAGGLQRLQGFGFGCGREAGLKELHEARVLRVANHGGPVHVGQLA